MLSKDSAESAAVRIGAAVLPATTFHCSVKRNSCPSRLISFKVPFFLSSHISAPRSVEPLKQGDKKALMNPQQRQSADPWTRGP